ncbi:putative ABC transporter ATP-binding protein [Metamycoplasma equirhinis]|uniref:ABC transporter ATP-binding protein n=1 Tax=Metamycoplasma equirhinis TaxID=92402 RepID=UPI00257321EB|nr:ABC transporter ATP-binding protein [Metamycoplasma equirhinis]BDX52917.1 putative ABC transporter ATP-binding protein [Metamycoplasma equirhinis]
MINLDPLKAEKKLSEMSKLEKRAHFAKVRKIKNESFKKLIKYLNYRKGIFASIVIITFLSTLTSTLGVFGFGYITDKYLSWDFIHSQYNGKVFLAAVGILALLYFINQAFVYWTNWLSVKAGMYTAKILRNEAYKSVMKMPISFFDRVNTGELMSIFSNDIENITNGICGSLNEIINTIFLMATSLIFMAYKSIYLTLIVLILFPIFMFIAIWLMKRAVPQYQKIQSRVAKLNGFVEEHLAAHHLIKSYNQNSVINDKFDVQNNRLYKASFKAGIYSNVIYPYVNVASNLLQLILVGIAAIFSLKGIGTGSNSEFTPGLIISFIMYIRRMSNEMARVFENTATIQIASVSASRVINLISLKPEVDETKLDNLDEIKGDVSFENVSFSYDKNSKKLQLSNATFKAKKGQTIAIVGPTGAGKTTIINLLSKFYCPNLGEIKIDNHKSTSINEHSWRSQISIVLQDTFLFKTTIIENLRYANKNASDEEIKNAARISKADDFIKQLKLGYETIIEEGGANFSQGERQLLAITRAIIANKSILILDEATSNIDTRTEKKIQNAMAELMKGKTSFVIAHRLSTIVNANKILVINEGKIIESGTHKQLLAKHGFYEKMYHSSFDEDA